jgi:hypothetical protein
MLLYLAVLLFVAPLWAANPSATSASPAGEIQSKSLEEVNKDVTNPLSSTWSISFQQNNYLLDIQGKNDHWNSNLNFQPVLPVALTKDWMLITRPVVPVFNSVPHFNPHNTGEIKRTTGLGDTILMEMLGPTPKLLGKWLLGLGPTFIFPTASSDFTGQGKWQAGPAGIVGYLSGKWSIGYSGNVLANWKADGDDVWTVPLGIGVGKVVKFGVLPVKVSLGIQYMVHVNDTGKD